ncbi:M3 family oligoendopeptidase [Candidatus Darwinibacter acetoxidans]
MDKAKVNWDLESIFPGGSSSLELRRQLEEIKERLARLGQWVEGLIPELDAPELKRLLDEVQDLVMHFSQCSAFVGCLTAQNVHDAQARLLEGDLGQMGAALGAVQTRIHHLFADIPQDRWEELLSDPDLKELEFYLNERRKLAQRQMDPQRENLAIDLAVDGYHAWSQLYYTLVGRMGIEVERDGSVQRLSMGQAANLLADPDPQLRREVFAKYEQAWAQEEELFASVLNRLAGFRLNLYKNRGWDDVLSEPLEINRMRRETLEAMWSAVEGGKPHLVKYLKRKAELLGLEGIAWCDLNAPLAAAGRKLSFEEGASFVLEQLAKFSPEMAEFTQKALESRWVEAEDRGGKRPGAFCTSFPVTKESRVFMTYAGTMDSVGTLAHELGHAYHGYVLKDQPMVLRRYAMNVAETASTFNELLVVDGAIQAAAPGEKLALLDDKIGRSVAFFMDIHSRFLFETRFYGARRRGMVSAPQLNELMTQAQRDAFLGSLTEYHPHFWASKLHFYITRTPFYNFPYTFGFLFASGVYARAKAEGPSFAGKYKALLADTARMTVEDLARKHLGVDLTKPDFWEAAVGLTIQDVEEFLRTAN